MHDPRNIVENTLVPHTAFQEASRRVEQCFAYAQGSLEPICLALVGESRTGKSRTLEECCYSHPTFRNAQGLTVPILRVTTPSKPTVKGLASLLLDALSDPKFDSGTEIAKTRRLVKLMCETSTKMVVIDEFQHFVDKGSRKVQHHVADWLKTLVDDCKVSLVVVGLPNCRAVLEQNEQLSGRFLSPVLMPRFDWRRDEDRDEFIAILRSLQDALGTLFQMPCLTSTEMAFRCFCGSGGLMGYLTKFLRQMVWNALDANTNVITLEDMLLAHEQSVWSTDGLQDLPNPFSREFTLEMESIHLLDKVSHMGVPVEPPPQSRRRSRSAEKTESTVMPANLKG